MNNIENKKQVKKVKKESAPVIPTLENNDEVNREEKKTSIVGRISSDTLLIILIPILAYIAAFSYEINYFRYFQIPLQLVTFDLSEIVGFINNDEFSSFLSLVPLLLIFFTLIGNFFCRTL